MDKIGFLKLLTKLKGKEPSIEVRKQSLEKEFSEFGYSVHIGYKAFRYFYYELAKAIDGIHSVYNEGIAGTIVHNKEAGHFGMVVQSTAKLKMDYDEFSELEKLIIDHDNANLSGFDYFKHDLFSESILKEVFEFLEKKEIISGNKSDFIAIFSKYKTVTAPITWQLTSQRNQAHQNALFIFLKMMFNELPRDVKRKAVKLFVDKNGYEFVNPKSGINPGVLKDRDTENNLKEILKIS